MTTSTAAGCEAHPRIEKENARDVVRRLVMKQLNELSRQLSCTIIQFVHASSETQTWAQDPFLDSMKVKW